MRSGHSGFKNNNAQDKLERDSMKSNAPSIMSGASKLSK